jgi:hypothetical protein
MTHTLLYRLTLDFTGLLQVGKVEEAADKHWATHVDIVNPHL